MFRPVLLTAVLALATPAMAGEPRAVYLARVELEARGEAFAPAAAAALQGVLAAFDAPHVLHQQSSPERGSLEVVFTAPDGAIPRALREQVRRVSDCAEPLSLYRARFRLRYGALPLPPAGGCKELDAVPPAQTLDLIGERDDCMNRVVREALVKATDEAARKAAEQQLEQVAAALSSQARSAQLVLRRVRTYLVDEAHGERQEAEVEALFLAGTWSEPFTLEAQRPVEGLVLERLAGVSMTAGESGIQQVLQQR